MHILILEFFATGFRYHFYKVPSQNASLNVTSKGLLVAALGCTKRKVRKIPKTYGSLFGSHLSLSEEPTSLNIYLFFILFIWLQRVLVVALGIFAAACRLLSRGMRDVGSSSPTRDRTRAPCLGSAKS